MLTSAATSWPPDPRQTASDKPGAVQGTKGKLSACFLALRVRVADGPVFGNNRHLPGEEVWLVGKWRSSGERNYYLSNLPARITQRALVGVIKARWVCEQAHQQLKEELGLDHFEGRSRTGLHRHALMTCLAFAYLQHRRLAGTNLAGRGKNGGSASRAAAFAEPAGRAPGDHRAVVRRSALARPVPLLPAPLPLAL
ncbi:transposase IS4 family protein (plasmid) [Methylobacterium aquaticum]|uniref:Transposase IS4 family protein n=1 Tax=Methylobacterium aquaticum TaxID=270351 RepID=A0A0C6FX73_9HYPH|nr:transposase IS4 family protein [Methylobacterium aquaticum]